MPPATPLRELPLLEIEEVEFVYRTNFAGAERPPFDSEGDRYFNAKIPSNEQAEVMARDGWNVKWTKPGKNATPEAIAEHVPEPYLTVALGFKFRAPTILLIKNINGVEKPTIITESNVSVLDSTEFTKVDCVVRARWYEMPSGQTGYKAWLAEFYGHVDLSGMGAKYAYLLDSPTSPSTDELTPDL